MLAVGKHFLHLLHEFAEQRNLGLRRRNRDQPLFKVGMDCLDFGGGLHRVVPAEKDRQRPRNNRHDSNTPGDQCPKPNHGPKNKPMVQQAEENHPHDGKRRCECEKACHHHRPSAGDVTGEISLNRAHGIRRDCAGCIFQPGSMIGR
jgi:hypothetical protein